MLRSDIVFTMQGGGQLWWAKGAVCVALLRRCVGRVDVFQAFCGCKVLILNVEVLYVLHTGVRGLWLGALSCCAGLELISCDEERAAGRGRAARMIVDLC